MTSDRQFALDEWTQCCAAVDAADPKVLAREIVDEQLTLRRLVFDNHDMGPLIHRRPPDPPARVWRARATLP